jgi:uncharacterized protein (DUF2141 family)
MVSGFSGHYKDLKKGSYAIAASHDPNRNRITDTNFVGLPSEDWGVSNNIRPSLGTPTFEEAKFDVISDKTIEVRLGR